MDGHSDRQIVWINIFCYIINKITINFSEFIDSFLILLFHLLNVLFKIINYWWTYYLSFNGLFNHVSLRLWKVSSFKHIQMHWVKSNQNLVLSCNLESVTDLLCVSNLPRHWLHMNGIFADRIQVCWAGRPVECVPVFPGWCENGSQRVYVSLLPPQDC